MELVYRVMMKFLIPNSSFLIIENFLFLIPHYFYSSYLVGSGMPA